MDPDWYELPVFYFSNPHCIAGPDEDVRIAPGSQEMDFELEVAAIVGMAGADLDAGSAHRNIAGYCVMNDWSARDIQRREMKLSMGPVKGKDFATTLGPMLVTPDELHRSERSGVRPDHDSVGERRGVFTRITRRHLLELRRDARVCLTRCPRRAG